MAFRRFATRCTAGSPAATPAAASAPTLCAGLAGCFLRFLGLLLGLAGGSGNVSFGRFERTLSGRLAVSFTAILPLLRSSRAWAALVSIAVGALLAAPDRRC